ncbi:DEAD/DEAH box helicase family protein [Sphingobacterium daejeonense]|uniref:DEAD/DEAH box helicase family protein n=1 Tax=Sphingobacterium daejeonense TaxID=371142 RepID=UPI0021A4BEC8|nr:DEAD/DEAH box helicase family protein [Sphingobacterium daejeonense]MCT1530197.1 DEAD/DEAH box helicase family protein [Sphingobacterium daejeonense]
MLKECDWSIDRDYKTGTENEPLQFYLDGLANSSEFHLLLGYFSSAAINLLSVGFATFISKGGKMRMVINHLLSEKDKEAFEKGQSSDNLNKVFDLSDVVSLGNVLDEYDTHFFECLAYLIAEKRIEIKVIKPKNNRGIAHYKSGVFSDGENSVGYKASCNFTLFGLSENLEELEAFLDWEDERSNKLIKKQLKIIDSYFSEQYEDVEYLSANEIEVAIKDKFGNKNIDELIVQEEQLFEKKRSLIKNNKLKQTIVKLYDDIDKSLKNPKFPYAEGPRAYQQIAFENWKNNNQQGLFAMATGTGKTITSLNCLLEVYKKTGYYKALILVPTITLVNQWENECKKFNFTNIVKVCSKSRWKNDFAAILTRERLSPTEQVSYIVISTYASFARENIFVELNQLPAKTLLIADECHNMGSGTLLKLLPKVNCKRRIGLSATPERQFDEEGNKKLFSFFNSEKGYTYEYSMEEAINNGVLCRYYYYPHLVSLTESEMRDYMELSLKISKFYKNESDSFSSNPILTALLLARKRIIHKASNKISVFNDILREQYKKKGNLKYALVYVPEGNDPNDYFETDHFSENDETENDNDAVHLIDVFTEAVKDIDKRTTIKQFISGTNDKEYILEQFANGEIDVLTSMKCLDEGVDVPRAELAIFCASTGNPRQFVQRRGRILRQHSEKQFAYIHDLVVIPEINPNSESYKMERSMLKKELERVNNFALLSENSSHTINVLLDTMNYYNLNLYQNE